MDPSSFGFLDFGAVEASAVSPSFLEDYLSRGYCAGMDYLRKNVDKRCNPSLLVEGARSILCFLAPYGHAEGGIAGFACGEDYHKVVKNRLFEVMQQLSQEHPSFIGRAFVDSAPVMERYWAARAGLGFIGQNGFLISPTWGLRTIIGVIICNVPCSQFPQHEPLSTKDCGACGRCRKACPSGALQEGGLVDAARCVSYRTIESREVDGCGGCAGWIFGCEECLNVCPWNKEVPGWSEFGTKRSIIREADWKNMTDEEFRKCFSDSGLMRAGLEKIKSNCNGAKE